MGERQRAVLTGEKKKRYEEARKAWSSTTDKLIKEAEDAQRLSSADFAVRINTRS
jgi:hypothetical protein